MEWRFQIRQPSRIILCTVFLILISISVMLFVLQDVLDRYCLSYAQDHYAYVGSVFKPTDESPDAHIIETDILEILEKSEHITALDIRKIYSAKAEKLIHVPDYFVAETSGQWFFLEGVVTSEPYTQNMGKFYQENIVLQVEKLWAGTLDMEQYGDRFTCGIQSNTPSTFTQKGERYFLVGRYFRSSSGTVAPTAVYALALPASQIFGDILDGAHTLFDCTIMHLPKEMSETERSNRIIDYLKDKGADVYIDTINDLSDVFTVQAVSDMALLLPVAEETMFYTEGRGIRRTDVGKQVCVISQHVADANNLEVGDSISLSVSESVYSTPEHQNYNCIGFESGWPAIGESLPEYPEPKEFEIIGIYYFTQRNSTDYYSFSYNDIFVPKETVSTGNNSVCRPYKLSFRIPGSSYQEFVDETLPALAHLGYYPRVVESGWDQVSENYTAMADRVGKMFIIGIIIFLLGIATFDFLIIRYYRQDYAIRCMMGANDKESMRAFWTPFSLGNMISTCISCLIVYTIYCDRLKPQVMQFAPEYYPSNSQVFFIIIGCVVAQVVFGSTILQIAAICTKKQSLLQMLK